MNRWIIGLVLLIMVVAGCSHAPSPGAASPPQQPSVAGRSAQVQETTTSVLPSMAERKIARTGTIGLLVDEVNSARDSIVQLASRLGGYIVSTSFSGRDGDYAGSISLRIPNEKFDEAVTELRTLAVRIASENIAAKDVTEEYVDLQSRLRNAQATERQYLELLDKANDVDSTLKVYDRLKQVGAEIEQIKGRIQYLDQTSAMSIITVQLNPVATAKPVVRSGWNAIEQLKSATRAFVVAIQVIGTIAIYAAMFSPIWGTPLAVVYFRNRRKKSNAAQ